ncbi:hypothetical protein AC578_2546 [Lecanosticta acicola]|uniref:Zinc finger PHD-type domain-containing protein n=1 Tax=Lecanosticta acicola TaxID=111012 RepID=A0AAI8YR84_9PEZI|nr:hypothetical protein AC578_2546 [Lecanosticta acicola]
MAETLGAVSLIINDSYTKDAYVRRRVGFLDRHPEFKAHPSLFPIARRDADEVFAGQPAELSCQAVRARELVCEIEPLLPFPTTGNMETLDGHASYPPTEWTPGSVPGPRAAELPRTPTPPIADTEPVVSSLAGRPVKLPVKIPRGSKRPRDSTPSASESSESSSSDEDTTPQPASKRPKLTLKAPSRPRPTIKTAPRKTSQRSTASQTNKATQTDAGATTNARNSPTDRIARIARGEIVPKSKQEATQAQARRKHSLLAESSGKGKGTARRIPDLMPEFFEKHNFTQTEREGNDQIIRCVCGATADDHRAGEEWIGCSGELCGGCWQHVACLGEAVAAEKEMRESEEYEYYCHLCDPMRHRKTLQRLRRGEVIQH